MLVIFSFFAFSFCQRWTSLCALEQKAEETETEIVAAKATREELEQKLALLDDEAYMQYLSRKRLCCLYPGEVYLSDYVKQEEERELSEHE